MPRLLLQLGAGAQAADVAGGVTALSMVQDAQPASQANAVIVSVSQVTPEIRTELAEQPGVESVHDDLQGIPLVAEEGAVTDFLIRVREVRGEDNAPPPLTTEPTRAQDVRTDGGQRSGATILPAPASARPAPFNAGPMSNATDSVDLAGATALHERGIRGKNIISVIVDTGVCNTIREERMLEGADLTGQDDPWDHLSPHGGMSLGIMAGDSTTPGIRTGFLPESKVYPIKTTLAASELLQAQDVIVNLADRNDETIVVNSSWGFPECAGICDHPITTAIRNAATHPNVIQVMAAGNSGGDAPQCGEACDGSEPGISGPNSLSEVITVGATGEDGDPESLHEYSSRGSPDGVACGRRKPDVVAPTFGVMPYGCDRRDMGNGGGTSAASPQVAGAVGLIADAKGGASTEAVRRGLMRGANPISGGGFDGCSGAGNLQAAEALGQTSAVSRISGAAAPGTGVVVAAGALGMAGALAREWLA